MKEHDYVSRLSSFLENTDLSVGKRVRLRRLLFEYGPGNGRCILLPIDHGLEHGPRDFFPNPESLDPEYQLRLAVEGGFSAIVLQVGLASKFMKRFGGELPLILKINGKTEVPSDSEAFSPLTATVKDAVRLGADAVGYTLYVGSPAQDRDFLQFGRVREEAEAFGMPVIVWAYPRGEAIEARGGKGTLYAIDYASRVAQELGADMVKLNLPTMDREKEREAPAPYNRLELSPEEAIEKVVASAGRTLVLVSGGARKGDDELLREVRWSMEAGATGLIFGRNLWQRKYDESLRLVEEIKRIIREVDGSEG